MYDIGVFFCCFILRFKNQYCCKKGNLLGYFYGNTQIKTNIDLKHEPYKEGANMYVAKFICDEKVNYNILKNS